MCVAMTPMMMLAGVAQIGGSMISASAQMREGRQAREIADRNAKITEEAGRYEAQQIRRQGQYVNSQARVQIASRGFAMSGSMLDILANNAAEAEIDAYNRQKYASDQAGVQRMEGKAAETRARNNAVATLIGGGTSFLKMVA